MYLKVTFDLLTFLRYVDSYIITQRLIIQSQYFALLPLLTILDLLIHFIVQSSHRRAIYNE